VAGHVLVRQDPPRLQAGRREVIEFKEVMEVLEVIEVEKVM
jgi:hypothetical protein